MMRIVVMALMTAFIVMIYGCKSDSVSPANHGMYAIFGKLKPDTIFAGGRLSMRTWYYPSEFTALQYVFTETTIDSTGEFHLIIPPAPDYVLTKRPFRYFRVSDTLARFYLHNSFYVDKWGKTVCQIFCAEKDRWAPGSPGSYCIKYLYSSRYTSIGGEDSSISPTEIIRYTYHIMVKPGWNQIVFKVTYPDSVTSDIVLL
ncbi:MAG: hypothetical protein NTV54_07720 [Ignavibacteriales bacterium]|nr:hypothetical protein [Ignavibacteriales bacterium]